MPDGAKLAAQYRRFAETEARGRSPLYEVLANSIADNDAALAFLLTLPPAKRQPNLLLAAVRHVSGTPANWPAFLHALTANADHVRSVMLTHATQTNEPARCAVLLPVLARLPQPLALIEVGASAGLCLLPDYYGYDYGGRRIHPRHATPESPVFACQVTAETPVPDQVPRIVWRAGLDLNPLDPADPAQTEWLKILVWPEQSARLAGLRAALRIAASVRPRVEPGDLLGDSLVRLRAQAPADATVVIFHTAVLAYVEDPAARQAFARHAMSLCPYWISNEAPGVFGLPGERGRFVLSVNGKPIARTDPQGAAIDWIGSKPDI